ncbi:MAG TPA: hypothetical protein VHB97_07915 [Polyangia bacterium]|nr:hypothetical protein [Polyangia bacterium]
MKWAAVRAWQQKHWQLNNLLADGLVGPKTLEAAKLLSNKNAPKQDNEGAEAEGGTKEQEAPQPGHADGAEAAADKPKLDDAASEEKASSRSGAPEAAPGTKPATLMDFEQALAKIDALAATFKEPKGQGARKPIAENIVAGEGDPDAPPAVGAMMSKGALGDYRAAAAKLVTKWTGLSPQSRADLLLQAVNDALSTETVPPITHADLQKLPNPGKFEAPLWKMAVDVGTFSKRDFKNKVAEINEASSTVFHEGRHAEQRFTAARLFAQEHKEATAEVVSDKVGIRKDIAQHAIALRAEQIPAEQQESARAFRNDDVDNKEAHQAAEKIAPPITEAANAAARIFAALSPEDQSLAGARWQECRQRVITILDSYYNLATERDAYAAEKQLGLKTK